MKHFVAVSLGVALFTCTIARASAQTDQVVGGFTSLTFNAELLSLAAADGVQITDLVGNSFSNGTAVLPLIQGVVDLDTAAANVTFKGGFQAAVKGETIRAEDLILHNSATGTGISGVIVEDGHVLGRMNIFDVNETPTAKLPLQATNGLLTFPSLSLGLTPEFVAEVNKFTGRQTLKAKTQVAVATGTAVVIPDTAAVPK